MMYYCERCQSHTGGDIAADGCRLCGRYFSELVTPPQKAKDWKTYSSISEAFAILGPGKVAVPLEQFKPGGPHFANSFWAGRAGFEETDLVCFSDGTALYCRGAGERFISEETGWESWDAIYFAYVEV